MCCICNKATLIAKTVYILVQASVASHPLRLLRLAVARRAPPGCALCGVLQHCFLLALVRLCCVARCGL